MEKTFVSVHSSHSEFMKWIRDHGFKVIRAVGAFSADGTQGHNVFYMTR